MHPMRNHRISEVAMAWLLALVLVLWSTLFMVLKLPLLLFCLGLAVIILLYFVIVLLVYDDEEK